MSGKAKQDAAVAMVNQNDWSSTSASYRRLFAPIIAGCVRFHRNYFSSRCAAGMASQPWHLSLLRFWH